MELDGEVNTRPGLRRPQVKHENAQARYERNLEMKNADHSAKKQLETAIKSRIEDIRKAVAAIGVDLDEELEKLKG